MELSEFIRVIAKWKWIALPIVILVTGFTYVTGMRAATTYQAQTAIVVGLKQMTSPGGAGYIAVSAPRIGSTFPELLVTEPVMQKAIEVGGLSMSPAALGSKITTEVPKDSTIIKITVSDADPLNAKYLADTVAEAFIQYIKDVNEANYQTSSKLIIDDIVKADNEIAAISASGSSEDSGRVRALQLAQVSMQTRLNELLNERTRSVDITVMQPASPYKSVGVKNEQRVIIGFVISVIVAIGSAFIAEAVQKALKGDSTSGRVNET